MATPRVFISSTYYDLQHVRNDINTFINGLGYEPVMHDKGNVTYAHDVTLEESCYNELETCDIVVCIIGNKFGTKSSNSDYSITMSELLKALNERKKIYIFILKDVYTENLTYLKNKINTFSPYHVDNIKIHEFIEELKEKVKNHPITPFEDVSDIINNLKLQFAGLFQHLMAKEATLTESKTFEDLQNSANMIQNLIESFTNEKDSFFEKFDSTIFATKPPIRKMLKLLNINNYQLFAPTNDSIKAFMNDLGYTYEEEGCPCHSYIYTKDESSSKIKLSMSSDLFDDQGYLKDIRDNNILEKDITLEKIHNQTSDDLPF